jgi:1-acyl-sn-glycerol-3-phosphate acyltransferase
MQTQTQAIERAADSPPRLDSLVHWAGVGATSIFWPLLSLGSSLFDRSGRLQYRCMVQWSRWCLRSGQVRTKVLGLEHVQRDLPQIFFSSHASIADICVLGAVLPVEYHWLARKEIFKIPFIGWHLSRSGHLKIDRGDRESAVRLLREAADRVRAGANVIVFPEGTRSEDGRLQPFKKGVFHLAIDAGVPIVPIRLLGSQDIVPKGSWELRAGEVTVAIGAPIPTAGLARSDLPSLMERVRSAMIDLEHSAASP